MAKNKMSEKELSNIIISKESLKNKIYIVRGEQVMLDADLAKIYGYETRYLNLQVLHNKEKFEGDDFMFQLSQDECSNLMLKNSTSSWGGTRKLPYVFTEQGIYMLMTVLKGELAIKQSRALVRAFKAMKDYIVEEQYALKHRGHLELAVEVAKHSGDIATMKSNLEKVGAEVEIINNRLDELSDRLDLTVNRDEISPIILDFTNSPEISEFVFMENELAKADETYIDICSKAKNNIYIIDNYISIKTLRHLQRAKDGINITIVSDNLGNYLHESDYIDFRKEFPGITIKFLKLNNRIHDRFIMLDCGTKDEILYHCGASIKDTGKQMTMICKYRNGFMVDLIEKLLGSLNDTTELRLKP
ncbi:ORF6N domain-containing protein [Candidatus Saccharibacteria bacterium]|nr:ORF6N domain-containing protein [Candidatus Saccharibacteria bacterium]